MDFIKKIFVGCSFGFLVLACGSGKEEIETKNEPPPASANPNIDNPGTGGDVESPPSDNQGDEPGIGLSGQWISSCRPDPERSPYKLYFAFNERTDEWVHALLRYVDSSCSNIFLQQAFVGTFSLGEELEDAEGVFPQDVDVTSITLAVAGREAVNRLNETKAFGYSDWQEGQRKELVGRIDAGGNEVTGFESFNVVRVSGDRLYMSEFADTDEDRDLSLVPDFFQRLNAN